VWQHRRGCRSEPCQCSLPTREWQATKIPTAYPESVEGGATTSPSRIASLTGSSSRTPIAELLESFEDVPGLGSEWQPGRVT
jgi:hypothetical protein